MYGISLASHNKSDFEYHQLKVVVDSSFVKSQCLKLLWLSEAGLCEKKAISAVRKVEKDSSHFADYFQAY